MAKLATDELLATPGRGSFHSSGRGGNYLDHRATSKENGLCSARGMQASLWFGLTRVS